MVQATEDDVTMPDELPQALQLLQEMNSSVQQVTQLVDNMLVRVKKGEISTDKGLSFLEVKYHMLLSYLINLTYVVLRKCSGRKIEGDPAIDRLVEIRTVLEKMRPIDQKMKYQITKLVKTAVAGAPLSDDPTTFHANPNNLLNQESDDSESENESEMEKPKPKDDKSRPYVPPKLAAVHYDGDERKADQEQRLLERARKRALNSSVMREMCEEYLDTPTEVTSGNASQAVLTHQNREREEYEETYFTRLPVTKQDRMKNRKMLTLGRLGDEITHFDDLQSLHARGSHSSINKSKRKRSFGSGKKKSFKKRKL